MIGLVVEQSLGIRKPKKRPPTWEELELIATLLVIVFGISGVDITEGALDELAGTPPLRRLL